MEKLFSLPIKLFPEKEKVISRPRLSIINSKSATDQTTLRFIKVYQNSIIRHAHFSVYEMVTKD
jgi:hypothetical protein